MMKENHKSFFIGYFSAVSVKHLSLFCYHCLTAVRRRPLALTRLG